MLNFPTNIERRQSSMVTSNQRNNSLAINLKQSIKEPKILRKNNS